MELCDISGIGKTRLKSLEEAGILSCRNLVDYMPRKYYNFKEPDVYLNDGSYKMIRARVIGDVKLARVKKNFTMTSVKMEDTEGNVFTAIWYNQPYVKNTLKIDADYFVYGKDDKKRKNTLVVNYYKSAEKADGLDFFPIYKAIGNVGSEIIRHAVTEALSATDIDSIISDQVCREFNLIDLKKAYRMCHMPTSLVEITQAKNRINLEQILPIVYASENSIKIGRNNRPAWIQNYEEILGEYKKLLPFELTSSQVSAIEQICDDLKGGLSMNRLLEGDVGSGKTAVAMFTLFAAAKCGKQGVLMAPTEILAKQHYELAKRLFSDCFGINVVYLSSSMSAAEKKQNLGYVKFGMANIIIGSHSVFSKGVEYANLAIAVIDEQHKFGVKARASLQEKGKNLDTLTMSATPIPRSLSLALQGSLDISILESRPHALSVQTNIVSQGKAEDMWEFINKKILNGSKVFVVCPKIDDSEDDGILDSSSAVSVYEYLKNRLDTPVVLVHGKMKSQESEQKISDFKSGESRCLVATTIVEVGVDAKDADIMVIENANAFGLASLHQLRGRVGRDGRDALCFCMVQNDISKTALDRLRFFKNNTNGFKIAEYDLETRGAGNLDGTEQHGFDVVSFPLVSIENLELAKKIAKHMKSKGETLSLSDEIYQKLASKLTGLVTLN